MVILALIGLVALAAGAWVLFDLFDEGHAGTMVRLRSNRPSAVLAWLTLALTGAAVLGFALGILAGGNP